MTTDFSSYPSLLESSDVDGGSSVAVLTYLRRILEALDHPDMIHLILHYLLALPDVTPISSGSRASISAARKRKSMDLATMMASQIELSSTPALFNLVDLIRGSLRSVNQQTVTVTLQLISVILRRHHRYAVTTLLRTSQGLKDGPRRTMGAHDKEMDFLLSMAGGLGGEDNFDEVYEDHIHDCMSILESHACSIPLIAPKSAGGTSKFPGAQASIPGAPRDIRSHTLRPEDPVLETILTILHTLFVNSVETNLSLTATIIDLATCGFMHIDGWLLPDPSQYVYETIIDRDGDDTDTTTSDDPIEVQEKAQLQALRKARRPLNLGLTPQPAILLILQTLVDQAATYRKEIPRFEDLLQQRREAFQTAAAAHATPQTHTPVHPSPPRSTISSTSRTSSPPRPSALDAFAQRIFPDLPSRSNSPRGRRSQETQNSSLSGGYGIATPMTSSRQPPAQFPKGLDTPSRGSSSRRGHSGSPMRDVEEKLKRHGVPASQAQAFAAVDQSILARKVGLPALSSGAKGGVEAIPFPDLKAAKENNVAEGGGREKDQEPSATKNKDSRDKKEDVAKGEAEKQVTVSHVLTNVLVLQEFLLELVALIQVRASLFAEVKIV